MPLPSLAGIGSPDSCSEPASCAPRQFGGGYQQTWVPRKCFHMHSTTAIIARTWYATGLHVASLLSKRPCSETCSTPMRFTTCQLVTRCSFHCAAALPCIQSKRSQQVLVLPSMLAQDIEEPLAPKMNLCMLQISCSFEVPFAILRASKFSKSFQSCHASAST